MADHFYDGQVRKYLTQFMRVISNFGYKDAKGQIVQVPIRYGDLNRQVANILKKNSENTIPSAPFIACYIKDLQFDRTRLQDPTFVSKVNIRERAIDPITLQYLHTQGTGYTIERIMPTPYKITFAADIWTTNLDQKLQLWEQIVVLFNPSLELQTTDNFVDWTSISVLELVGQTWSSRAVPQGVDSEIDIQNLTFEAPIWITPPAKVKKLGIVMKIINNISLLSPDTIATEYSDPDIVGIFGDTNNRVVVTPGDFDLLVLNNTATLIKNNHNENIDTTIPQNTTAWPKLLDLYPGQFKAGISQLRLTKPGGYEIVAYMASIDPLDDTKVNLSFDADTFPTSTFIINAIVNPETFNPINRIDKSKFLILENINITQHYGEPGFTGPEAWKNNDNSDFQANANDIIEWDETLGSWKIIFNSIIETSVTYITNAYTNVQYKWSEGAWSKSFEGVYDNALWRLIL